VTTLADKLIDGAKGGAAESVWLTPAGIRDGGSAGVVGPTPVSYTVDPTTGAFTTVDLVPGRYTVRIKWRAVPMGEEYQIDVPTTGTGVKLWPLIADFVRLPPDTPMELLAKFFADHPELGGGTLPEYLAEEALANTYAPIGSTGATTVDALTDAGTVGKAVAKATTAHTARTAISAVASTFIPGIGNSWWQKRDCQYNPKENRLWIGGIDRGGAQYMAVLDLFQKTWEKFKITEDRFFLDDHMGMGMVFDLSLNRRPYAICSPHDKTNELHVRESNAYQSFENLGPEQRLQFNGGSSIAYGSGIVKPSESNKRINSTSGSAVLQCVTSILAPTDHLLVDGMRYRWTEAGAPAPFVPGTSYYVVNSAAESTQFGLSATPGGVAITPTQTVTDGNFLITDSGRGLVHCRTAQEVWMARSADMMVGVTERPTSTPAVFDDTSAERFKMIARGYVTTTQVGNTLWGIATGDPTPAGDPASAVPTYFFKGVVGGSGALRNAAGNIIAHLWGPAPAAGQPLIPLTGSPAADLVRSPTGNEGLRWYNVARGGDMIGVCRFDRRDFDVDELGNPNQAGRSPLNGGMMSVLRRKTSATTNDWIFEDVILSGPPFGAFKSVYIGGSDFEREAVVDNALLCVYAVQIEGVWRWKLGRFTRTGPAYPTTTPGVWTLDRDLFTAPAGHKLGRPRVPYNIEDRGAGKPKVAVVSVYPYYSNENFIDFVAGQEVIEYA
jgi:hypothetical protein